MRLVGRLGLLILLTCFQPLWAWAEEPIGVVRTLTGSATVTRGDSELPVVPGFKLMEGDLIKTAQDSSVGIFMRDDASLSLGPQTHLLLDRFRFSPAAQDYSFISKITKGTMCYLSGQIGKLSPESTVFQTPVATVSPRGTYFVVKVDG